MESIDDAKTNNGLTASSCDLRCQTQNTYGVLRVTTSTVDVRLCERSALEV